MAFASLWKCIETRTKPAITIEDFLKKLEEELNKNLSFKKKALPKKY
jgi:hypothetical protein